MLQDASCVAFRKHCAFAQFSDSTLAFFAKIVSFSGLFVDDFSRPGHLESLLGAAIRFHFRHNF